MQSPTEVHDTPPQCSDPALGGGLAAWCAAPQFRRLRLMNPKTKPDKRRLNGMRIVRTNNITPGHVHSETPVWD